MMTTPSSFDYTKFANDVKRANQRLRQLEKKNRIRTGQYDLKGKEIVTYDTLTNSPAYRYIEQLAYDNMPYMATTKNGQFKFRTDIKKLAKTNLEAFYELHRQVEHFLNVSKTSTVKGITEVYAKQFRAFLKTMRQHNPQYNIGFNDYLDMWSNDVSNAINVFGSTQIIDLYTTNVSELGTDAMQDFIKSMVKEVKDDDGNIRYKASKDIIDVENQLETMKHNANKIKNKKKSRKTRK